LHKGFCGTFLRSTAAASDMSVLFPKLEMLTTPKRAAVTRA
jgi:hypothetical protein